MYPDCNGNGVRSPTIQVQTYATKSFNHDDDGDRGQSDSASPRHISWIIHVREMRQKLNNAAIALC